MMAMSTMAMSNSITIESPINGETITISESINGVKIEGVEGVSFVDGQTAESYKRMIETAETEEGKKALTAQFLINNGEGAINEDIRKELWKKSQEATKEWAKNNPEKARDLILNGGDSGLGDNSYNTFIYNATGKKVTTEDAIAKGKEIADGKGWENGNNIVDLPEGNERPSKPSNPIEGEDGDIDNSKDPEKVAKVIENKEEIKENIEEKKEEVQATVGEAQSVAATTATDYNNRFSDTRSQMKEIGAQSAALTSAAVAATQQLEVGEMGVGAGFGSYSDKSAAALSVGLRPTENTNVNASWSHGDDYSDMVGV